MKTQIKFLIFLAVTGLAVLLLTRHAESETAEEPPSPVKAWVDPLSHAQRVWLGALEWCESKGNGEAINKVDRDGTPSYYWYQFKPGTFRGFAEKYGLIEKGKTDAEIAVLMKSYELTNAMMEQMILDPTITAKTWRYQLFPGCTEKLGTPPRLSTKTIDKV